MNDATLVNELMKLIGAANVVTDDRAKQQYGSDLTQDYTSSPRMIVFPNNEKEVMAIVHWANTHQVALVPSGGRTGYSGGAVAANHEVVVSLDKMNRIVRFNAVDRQLTCEAGTTTKRIQAYATARGYYYPVDYAATDTCHIGGNIATNAGGVHVIRYGSTRQWIAGLKVVTGKGDLLVLNRGLLKNSAGYDLRHLFIGSEGTLGLITEATIQLTTAPKKSKIFFCSTNHKKHFIDILQALQQVVTLIAYEFIDEKSMDAVTSSSELENPFPTPHAYYLLVTYESDANTDQLALNTITTLQQKGEISKILVSHSEQEAHHFWQFRLRVSTSLAPDLPYKYDIAVLPSKIPDFMDDIDNLFDEVYPHLDIVWWGHVGDGNLHLNILKPPQQPKESFFRECHAASEKIYALIASYQGTISAEHGIGLLKKPFLKYARSQAEIDSMRAIKQIFDPNHIMNPGKLL